MYGSSGSFHSSWNYKVTYNDLRSWLSSIIAPSQTEKKILAHISTLVIYVLSHLYTINKLC